TEQLPLLAPAGDVQIAAGRATVVYPGGDLTIEFGPSIKAEVRTGPTTRGRRNSLMVGDKQLVVLELSARDALQYRIRFTDHGSAAPVVTKAPPGRPYPEEFGE